MFHEMEAGFACGSMVLLYLFHKTFGSVSQIFVKKDVQFRPTGGDICFQTSDRVSPVIHTTYAVGIQIRHLPG